MRGLGVVVAILVGAVPVMGIALIWVSWHVSSAAVSFDAEETAATRADLRSALDLMEPTLWGYCALLIISLVALMAWLWRARVNAELLCPGPHRRERVWVVWSWLCPIAQLWYPYQVIDDVHRASRPDTSPDVTDLREVPGSGLLGLWSVLWGVWLVVVWFNVFRSGPADVATLRTTTEWVTVEVAFLIGAAVPLVFVVLRISRWQDGRQAPAS